MNITEVHQKLETLPSTIAYLATQAEDLRMVYQQKELDCEIYEARKALEVKAHNQGITQIEIKNRVIDDPEYQERRMACITAESTYRKKGVEVTKMDNLYTALKKIVEIQKIEGRL